MKNPKPEAIELQLISFMGRVERLMDEEGLTILAALERLSRPESVEAYVARNKQAMERAIQHLLDPDFHEAVAAAQSESDPAVRAQMLSNLQRRTHGSLDIEAIHRVIGSRNKQWRAEGILPPDCPNEG